MKAFVISILALAGSSPALAQSNPTQMSMIASSALNLPPAGFIAEPGNWGARRQSDYQRIQAIFARIDRSRADGSLSPAQAGKAYEDLSNICRWIQATYRPDRATMWDSRARAFMGPENRIAGRLDTLEQRIDRMAHDNP